MGEINYHTRNNKERGERGTTGFCQGLRNHGYVQEGIQADVRSNYSPITSATGETKAMQPSGVISDSEMSVVISENGRDSQTALDRRGGTIDVINCVQDTSKNMDVPVYINSSPNGINCDCQNPHHAQNVQYDKANVIVQGYRPEISPTYEPEGVWTNGLDTDRRYLPDIERTYMQETNPSCKPEMDRQASRTSVKSTSRTMLDMSHNTLIRIARQLSVRSHDNLSSQHQPHHGVQPDDYTDGAAGQKVTYRKPNPHNDLALFSCLCCLSPLGIVAMIFAGMYGDRNITQHMLITDIVLILQISAPNINNKIPYCFSALTEIRYQEGDMAGARKASRLALILAVSGILLTLSATITALAASAAVYYSNS